MADSTRLLSQTEPSESDTLNYGSHPQSMDDIIEACLSGFRWRQILQALLVSLAWFFDGQQACISDFTDAEPSWHCTNISNTTCDSSSNQCSLPAGSWAWNGSASQSIISEWGLECSSSLITGLPTSAFYLGCLIGGIVFATLADSSLGRKKILILSCMVMSIAALATSFSINIWMYSAFRLVSGFGRASIGTCALVLSTEMVSKQSRGLIGMMGLFIGTLGLLSLSPIAYLLRNTSWRYLYISTSTPGIIYCVIVFFFVSESPKWLLMQGREAEAIAILKKISPTNYHGLDLYLSNKMHLKQDVTKNDLYSSMKDLFRSRWALDRLIKVMILGFGVGMMYYGMLLGVGDLGFDLYLSVAFNALIIVPSYFLSYYLINKWRRKGSLLAFTLISGILSIVCAFVGLESAQVGLELASFFCICVSYNVLMIYTIELFPTKVRNSSTSMLRQAIILGVLLDPTLISAGRDIKYLTYLVFGLVIILCGLIVILLPETKGVTLSNTMEEQEQKDNSNVLA